MSVCCRSPACGIWGHSFAVSDGVAQLFCGNACDFGSNERRPAETTALCSFSVTLGAVFLIDGTGGQIRIRRRGLREGCAGREEPETCGDREGISFQVGPHRNRLPRGVDALRSELVSRDSRLRTRKPFRRLKDEGRHPLPRVLSDGMAAPYIRTSPALPLRIRREIADSR
jgi:hypothetical protein